MPRSLKVQSLKNNWLNQGKLAYPRLQTASDYLKSSLLKNNFFAKPREFGLRLQTASDYT